MTDDGRNIMPMAQRVVALKMSVRNISKLALATHV